MKIPNLVKVKIGVVIFLLFFAFAQTFAASFAVWSGALWTIIQDSGYETPSAGYARGTDINNFSGITVAPKMYTCSSGSRAYGGVAWSRVPGAIAYEISIKGPADWWAGEFGVHYFNQDYWMISGVRVNSETFQYVETTLEPAKGYIFAVSPVFQGEGTGTVGLGASTYVQTSAPCSGSISIPQTFSAQGYCRTWYQGWHLHEASFVDLRWEPARDANGWIIGQYKVHFPDGFWREGWAQESMSFWDTIDWETFDWSTFDWMSIPQEGSWSGAVMPGVTNMTVYISGVFDSGNGWYETAPIAMTVSVPQCPNSQNTPPPVQAGCTDPAALNYQSSALINDGSCRYEGDTNEEGEEDDETEQSSAILGCTDSSAINYNAAAEVEDGSCIFPSAPVLGCTDVNATNYLSTATADDGSCLYPDVVSEPVCDSTTIPVDGVICSSGGSGSYSEVSSCTTASSANLCTYTVPVVTPPVVSGCTNRDAINYRAEATQDDGSCIFPPEPILGCTDVNATNYLSTATADDGSCLYEPQSVLGCMDLIATNYDSTANVDDGSCLYLVFGCTDPAALNYALDATVEDGSCEYLSDTSIEAQSLSCNENDSLAKTRFTWTGIAGVNYEVYRADIENASDLSFIRLASPDAPINNQYDYTDVSGLTAGVTYYYKVKAYMDGRYLGESNVISIVARAPQDVCDLRCVHISTVASATGASVTWEARGGSGSYIWPDMSTQKRYTESYTIVGEKTLTVRDSVGASAQCRAELTISNCPNCQDSNNQVSCQGDHPGVAAQFCSTVQANEDYTRVNSCTGISQDQPSCAYTCQLGENGQCIPRNTQCNYNGDYYQVGTQLPLYERSVVSQGESCNLSQFICTTVENGDPQWTVNGVYANPENYYLTCRVNPDIQPR